MIKLTTGASDCRAPTPADQVDFLNKLQRLLSEGLFTATYKYALLSALADLSIEQGDDSGRGLQLSLFAIAEKFFEYYWRQALPYASADVLKQNTGRPATILTLVARARSKYGPALPTLKKDQASWTRLVNSFIPTLQEQPLWRLQKIGKENLDFLYGPSKDSRSIQLRPGVPYCFRKFHPLIQDMVQSGWLRAVRSMNGDVVGEQIDLSEFLFGSERNALLTIRPLLTDLQKGLCFYCSRKVGSATGEVDHFVPWSRYPADLAHNLVLADRKCNGQKRDRIPAVTHLAAWRKRNDLFGNQITAGMASRFPCDPKASTRIAYWAYEQTEAIGGLSWLRGDELVPITAEWRSLLA